MDHYTISVHKYCTDHGYPRATLRFTVDGHMVLSLPLQKHDVNAILIHLNGGSTNEDTLYQWDLVNERKKICTGEWSPDVEYSYDPDTRLFCITSMHGSIMPDNMDSIVMSIRCQTDDFYHAIVDLDQYYRNHDENETKTKNNNK